MHLNTVSQRQKAFGLFADHLALQGKQLATGLPKEIADLQRIVASVNVDSLMETSLKRTQWLVNSIVLGSEGFCQDMIRRFRLQPGRVNRPRAVNEGLYNSHQRAGPGVG